MGRLSWISPACSTELMSWAQARPCARWTTSPLSTVSASHPNSRIGRCSWNNMAFGAARLAASPTRSCMTPRPWDGTTSPPPTLPLRLPRWLGRCLVLALRRSEIDAADGPHAAVESVLHLPHLGHSVCELDQLRRRIASCGDDVYGARPVLDHVDDLRGRDPAPVHRIRDLVEDDEPVVARLDL